MGLDERPNSRVISAMCWSDSSLRFEPRLFRIFCQKPLASIICTRSLRCSGLRLLSIQT